MVSSYSVAKLFVSLSKREASATWWEEYLPQMRRRTITILRLIQNVMGEVVCKTCAAFYLHANVFWGG
ncbi:MAG TPA: hypothetical protein DC084_05505 [Cupriavidus sp.]|nr:hypothetical protein [Pseudomonadales bacterium]HBD33034.1 hypothetical protein [Cupriavidus sp.]